MNESVPGTCCVQTVHTFQNGVYLPILTNLQNIFDFIFCKKRKREKVDTAKQWCEGMTICTHVLWSSLNIFRHWPPLPIITNVIRSPTRTDSITKTTVSNQCFGNDISCDLSHKHCAPGRPVWSIQTLGFPTISVIRSRTTHICNPRTFKIRYWNCFEIKAWTLADTLLLWEHFRSDLAIPLSVVCNSDYCN